MITLISKHYSQDIYTKIFREEDAAVAEEKVEKKVEKKTKVSKKGKREQEEDAAEAEAAAAPTA